MPQCLAKTWRMSLATALFVVGSGFLGCTPSETGPIDIAKSKAIAAEKGIGPGMNGTAPPKAARPATQPNAPTLPPGR